MAKNNEFVVTEDKSTVQNLVDYNSNVLLPYTILDAITEYGGNPVRGMKLIYKNLLNTIADPEHTINTAVEGVEYYPVMFDRKAYNRGDYLGGLVIGTQSFSENPTADGTGGTETDYSFLTQGGTFENPPKYTFLTDLKSQANTSADKPLYFTQEVDTPAAKQYTLNLIYDGLHFTHTYDNKKMFGAAGSLHNFLNAIDHSIEYTSGNAHNEYNPVNAQGMAVSGRYVSMFYKPFSEANELQTTACEMKDVLTLTVGYATHLKALNHYSMIDSDSSTGTIGQNNTDKFVVYQNGTNTTKFLKVPTDVFANDNGNICLVASPVSGGAPILKWDTAGIDMYRKENDDTEHYLLGTPFNSSTYEADSSIRKDKLIYSVKTYFKNGSVFQLSDERMKTFLDTNISLKDIMKIKVSKFVWNNQPNLSMKHFGVSAQSVEEVVPEIVSTNIEGYKSVEYDKLGALSIYGIQLLVNEIADLKAEIKQIKSKLNL